MVDASKDPDQSMEDILQSIKRIIADEGEPAPAASAGSDVLELTELLAEDVATPAEEPAVPSISIDEIMGAPSVAAAPAPAPAPEPEPVFEPEPIVMAAPEPVAPPPPVVAAPEPAPVAEESLMSEATVAASMAALNALAHKPTAAVSVHASPSFRSGETVEDLVIEALRPMLKEWLDNNLPSMVRTLVEKEIRRLSS